MSHHCFALRLAATIILQLCMANLTFADSDISRDFGVHVIHCRAMPSNALDSNIASQFEIGRAKDRGVLNIAVMEKSGDGAMDRSIHSKVTAHWSDLNGRMGSIAMREFQQQNAIYYIGEFGFIGGATMTFNILVSVDENRAPYSFSIEKQFPAE